MAKVKITGHASGTGILTVTAPNTSTDRTITLPDATGTLLTEVADDSITLAKMAGGTDGNIISYDASGNPVAVATGSAGQVLTSAGAGAPPTFAAGGAYTLIESFDTTATWTITKTSVFSSTYRHYLITFENINFGSDGGLGIRLKDTSGGTYSAYQQAHTGWDGAAAGSDGSDGYIKPNKAAANVDAAADTTGGVSGYMFLMSPYEATGTYALCFTGAIDGDGDWTVSNSFYASNASTQFSGFLMEEGQYGTSAIVAGGKVSIYGMET